MDMSIIEDKRNEHFSRREITYTISGSNVTPSKKDILAKISGDLKVQPDCIYIDGIYQKYGRHDSVVRIKVYDKPELVLKTVKKEKKTEEKKE